MGTPLYMASTPLAVAVGFDSPHPIINYVRYYCNQIISQLIIGLPSWSFFIGRVGGAYKLAVWTLTKALMVGVLLGIGIGITQGMFKVNKSLIFPVDGLAWHKDFTKNHSIYRPNITSSATVNSTGIRQFLVSIGEYAVRSFGGKSKIDLSAKSCNKICPLVGWFPPKALISVDLPEPLCPIKA